MPLLLPIFGYFLLQCGYYVLRPLRDELGVRARLENIHYLFLVTFLGAMFVVTPLFGALTARVTRRRVMPLALAACIAQLAALAAAFAALRDDASAQLWLARVTYVWISLFSLFIISAYWSFMTELYAQPAAARRAFASIAAGGSAGALVGPILCRALLQLVAEPVPAHFLSVSVVLLLAAYAVIERLSNDMPSSTQATTARTTTTTTTTTTTPTLLFDSLRLAISTAYLRAICGFMLCLTGTQTLLYLLMSAAIADAYDARAERLRQFATIDLMVNVAVVPLQLFATSRVVARVGVRRALVALPLLMMATFAACFGVGAGYALPTLVALNVSRRVTSYALTRPLRELLFTVVEPAAKWRAKNVVDTVVYRAGDALGAQAFALAHEDVRSLACVGVVVSGAWLLVAAHIGAAFERRSSSSNVVVVDATTQKA